MSADEAPSGIISDNSYAIDKQEDGDTVPVVTDNAPIESGVDASKADSDEMLGMFPLPHNPFQYSC